MFLAGANFVLQVKIIKSFFEGIKNTKSSSSKFVKNNNTLWDNMKIFLSNSELIAYILIIVVAATIVSLVLALTAT